MVSMDNLIFLDFETYYDDDYGLKKLTMSEYIRHPKFFIQGVSVKLNDEPVKHWRYDSGQSITDWLDQFPWGDALAIAHNMQFDGLILFEKCGIVPLKWGCTKKMARAEFPRCFSVSLNKTAAMFGIGQKIEGALANVKGIREPDEESMDLLMAYCDKDVELCAEVFHILRPQIPDPEMELIHLTLQMFCEPVFVLDTQLLYDIIDDYDERARELIDEVSEIFERRLERISIGSRNQFADLLRELSVAPPMKPSPSDPDKMTYAFAKKDLAFVRLQNHPDPRVRKLMEARLHISSRIEPTRAQRFLSITDAGRLPLPIALNYCEAHTTRWSGGDRMNAQNLKRKSKLRRSLHAPDGFMVCAGDLSQIEARTLAWLAGQESMLAEFRKGEEGDVYKQMASIIFNMPVSDIGKESTERFVGKTAVLGLGYGMGAAKFFDQLLIEKEVPDELKTQAFAQRVVNTYRRVNYAIVDLWDQIDRLIPFMADEDWDGTEIGPLKFRPGKILLPNGLRIDYPDMIMDEKTLGYTYQGRDFRVNLYGALIVENFTQALARCVIGEQMLRIAQDFRIATTTHDEIVAIVPEDRAQEAEAKIDFRMRYIPRWASGLPIDCEVYTAENYAK